MVALMFDGLELGKFIQNSGKLELKLNKNISIYWLPYIFQLGIKYNADMQMVIDNWKKERVFQKNRLGQHRMLKKLGLKRYDVDKITEITRCSILTDPYWIAYKESDTYTTHSVRGKLHSNDFHYNSMELKNEQDYIWRI